MNKEVGDEAVGEYKGLMNEEVGDEEVGGRGRRGGRRQETQRTRR